MHQNCPEMMALFEGWHKNYGIYKLTGELDERGKALGTAHSLSGTVSVELWHGHLTGTQGLGIIPITDKSKVKFAAIDIDEYPLDLAAIARNIRDEKLPLTVIRTKSGGAHLYLFLSDWTSAKFVQQKMREMAAHLGYGNSEIFPKQTTILAERGDVGQWINMPYFDESKTDRYAVSDLGKRLSLKEFIRQAQERIISPEDLALVMPKKESADPLPEGPPCLNALASRGFPMGTRNNGLFNLGIYAMKVDPDNWESLVGKFNSDFMNPALSATEVSGVIKSLRKAKGYNYTCKQQPISSYCNVSKCRACKYGIGVMGMGMPKYGTLCKIATNPPVWFVDVEGGARLELDTQDLQFIKYYQTRCMDALSIMPPLVKNEIWCEIVSKLMDEVTVVEVPMEATPKGVLYQLVEEFCTSRVQAKTHDELLLGKPWISDKRVYFRLRDLMSFLERQKFREFGINRVMVYLRDWGAEKHFMNIKGHGCNCCSLPEFRTQDEPFDVPEGIKKPDVI